MNVVTLYKWHDLQAVEGWHDKEGFSFSFCGSYGFVDCENGQTYELPAGYEVSESVGGFVSIYDEEGHYCYIEIHKGRPLLRSTRNGGVILNPIDMEEIA